MNDVWRRAAAWIIAGGAVVACSNGANDGGVGREGSSLAAAGLAASPAAAASRAPVAPPALMASPATVASRAGAAHPAETDPDAAGDESAGADAPQSADRAAENAEVWCRARKNPNPVLFRKCAHPYGTSMVTWSERVSQWIYRQPKDRNPILDQTGKDCAVDQHGPVWFIPPIENEAPVFRGARACTIPHGKAVLLDIGAFVNPFPRPDPNYRPAPGQDLFDYLVARAKRVMDTVDLLQVSLDDKPLEDVLGYRFVSETYFHLTGDTSLLGFDPRITGWGQPAVSDGFFMMFKPLKPGRHTLWVHGTNTGGDDKTYTYHLTIE
ncbi:hypothetical protein [Pendulispora albinea]|uniref:Uncharacterized protein n=1 Tax=Pendulispora albinea TaxID=2741071 RepID=A0ABZ2M817_9BACT